MIHLDLVGFFIIFNFLGRFCMTRYFIVILLQKIFNSIIDLNISFTQVYLLMLILLHLSEGAFAKESLKLLDFHWIDVIVLRLLKLLKMAAIG